MAKRKQKLITATRVEVNLPACIQVNLVQANELRCYEIALWLGSLFASSAVGFWTAYLTTNTNAVLFWVGIVFTTFTIIFVGIAWHYRSKIKSGEVKKITTLDKFE